MSSVEAPSIFKIKGQVPIFLVGFGHGSTHWILATVYLLLPFLVRDLELSYSQAGLFVSIIQVSALLCNFGSGLIVDLTGRRVVFLGISLVAGATGLIVLGTTGLFVAMCLAVALIGASNNLWHSPAISFLSSQFPHHRGYVLSIHATGASLGDAIAPAVAGVLLLSLSWQQVALVNALPVFAIAAILVLALLPKDRAPTGRHGRRGLAFGQYLNGLRGILRARSVLLLALTAGFRSMAQNGIIVFLPLYLVHGLAFNPAQTGGTIMLMQISGLVAGLIAGILSDRLGRRPVILCGLSATTVVILAATFITDAAVYIGCVSVLGFVLFALRPVIQSWMLDLTPQEMGGSATSMLFGAQSLMSATVPIAGGIIADLYGLQTVFYCLAIFMLIANLCVLPLRAAGRREGAPNPTSEAT